MSNKHLKRGVGQLAVPQISHYSSYLQSRRRSKSCNDLILQDEESEVTPLLLAEKLHNLLKAPKDKGKRVCIIFCYLGMCCMLPWNLLVSISGFWNFKFRDVNMTDPSGTMTNGSSISLIPLVEKPTDLQLSFPSYLAIASYIPGAITTLIHSSIGQRVRVETRLLWSVSMLLASFACLLTLSIPNSDPWQAKFLHIVLMIVVLCNVGVSIMQGSMFGISGRFPPKYVGYVMMGMALGGVIPASAAVALIAFDVRPQLLGPTCFVAIMVLLILAIALTRWLGRSRFFLYFAEGKNQFLTYDPDHESEVDNISYTQIFMKSFPYQVAGFLNYAVTIGLFPGLTTLVESSSSTPTAWSNQFFKPVAVVLFNIFDLCGRTLASFFQWPGRSTSGKYGVMIFSILRIGLVPLFMLCNAAPHTRKFFPILMDSDIVFYILIILLSVSVGYTGNICLIHAPKTSTSPECQEATSLILTAAFVLGQASGSFLSYIILQSL